MRVLVAGGAGFIGSHLCERLLAEGNAVICVDNYSTGSLENIAHLATDPGFQALEGDVCTPFDCEADLVMHLASPASPVAYQAKPVETALANSVGTANLVELALRNNARFLLASTSEIYGDPLEHPQTEAYRGNVDPIGPRSCYDEGKRFAEALTIAAHRQYGLNCAIFRIFNTYGPRMAPADGRVIPAFIEAALDNRPIPIFGDGTQTRSFCYVSDLVEGLLAVAMDTTANGEVFNVGNPLERTMLELAASVCRALGKQPATEHLPLPEQDPRRRRPDVSKIQAWYGWQPRVSLEDGLQRTASYFRELRAREVPAR